MKRIVFVLTLVSAVAPWAHPLETLPTTEEIFRPSDLSHDPVAREARGTVAVGSMAGGGGVVCSLRSRRRIDTSEAIPILILFAVSLVSLGIEGLHRIWS